MGLTKVPHPTPSPFNALPSSKILSATSPVPKSHNCKITPATYSVALNSKHGFRPHLEQIGIPKGTPKNAPTSQYVTIRACAEASSAGVS